MQQDDRNALAGDLDVDLSRFGNDATLVHTAVPILIGYNSLKVV
jgi:hypothetical protein